MRVLNLNLRDREDMTDEKQRLNVTVSRDVHARLTVLARRCGFRGVPAMVSALLRLTVESHRGAASEQEQEAGEEDSVAAMFSALAEAERSRVDAAYRLRTRI